ncbi:16S rRNA (adenine(1518)-N(6)/adenine(1519)-N(6))-dimethyltransferase RsmA [Candidatus Omnitrophota bacterium]
MLTKNELKVLWKAEGFRPLKRFGQNFLIDKNIKDKIVRSLDVGPDDTVLEVGAGFGEITFDLASRAKRVFAVEKDKKIAAILRSVVKLPENVTLLEQDFLDLDIKAVAGNKKITVYGSLPYYITTPIIEKLFDNIQHIKGIYFVVQKEFAERILARPGTKSMARISLFVQYFTAPRRMFMIGKECFYPAPEIDSAFLKLEIPENPRVSVNSEELLFRVIKSAYSQRRKTLLNSLSSLGLGKTELSKLLKAAKIDPKSRAENLSLEDFARLTSAL